MTRVLVVDDSAMDRKLAGGLLDKQGWQIVYATNGIDALAMIERQRPDVVITDLQMPEMNGLELVKHIKENFSLIPVVLMTAKGNEEIAVEALQYGAASYVPKRCLSSDLTETIGRVLSASQEERSHAKLLHRMTECEYHFELENDFSLITPLTGYLQQAFRAMGICEEAECVRVGIALEEALVNAVYHGNLEVSSELREVDHKQYYDLARSRAKQAPFRDRRTFIQASYTRDSVTYVIRDQGPGFDPAKLPDPTDPANLDRPCGRGVLLMRTFMDEVRYNSRGNEVTLVKTAVSSVSELCETPS